MTNRDADYEDLLELETAFLEHVNDEEIKTLYMGVRRGGDTEFQALVRIAKGGWSNPRTATPKMSKADRAIQIIQWFRTLTH